MLLCFSCTAAASEQPELEQREISYYRDVRPILQSRCHGCHQPAKRSGDYEMTDFTHLLAGGESQQSAVVAGNPQMSSLLQLVLPVDGQAEMPKNQEPLLAVEIETLRGWITAGARDDTPESAQRKIDADNPPIYSRPPIVTSLDYSPDGELLAVSGFHEVLLHRANGSQLVGRLVGLSARIESLEFSPDGRHLAVCGGLPERMGELQVWDVATRRLELSVVLTYETLRGVSWSPDGKNITVACADNTVRGVDAQTGEQTFFSGAHDDWGLDTVFSRDGSHLVSVGRDMTTKLYHLPTQRFIDNLTSITPGALNGGLAALARHPQRDEVLVGGADGIPRIYRMHRETKRVIGDDANLIRRFSAMRGRIYSVDFSNDGKWIACGSSLDGQGQVFVYSSDYDGALSEELKKILEKLPGSWSAAERELVESFVTANAAVVSKAELPTGIYSVAFSPDGETVSAAGNDGWIRQLNPQDGTLIRQWVSIDSTALESMEALHAAAPSQATPESAAALAGANHPANVPSSHPVSYVQDVMPIISRLGCNAGTCHGAKEGKEGFKLSLRGYDPLFDVRGWTDDLKARRINFASPDDSLLLLKATGAVPHVGGQLIPSDSTYYRTLRRWIAEGAQLDLESPRVERIRLEPLNPVIEEIGGQQQMRVFATYTDGSIREVTSEAFIESGNTDIVAADAQRIVRTLRRGEAPILARYEGAYAATILTAMGDRSGFEWSEPENWNRIDELVAAKWQRMKILPSELCTDEEFIRRVYLDLTGLPPQLERLQSWWDDSRPSRIKRSELIDELIGCDDFVTYWTNKWADLLQVNSKFLGVEGAKSFRDWIRANVEQNRPYDQFCYEVLTAQGSNKEHPPAAYFKILRTPEAIMENTTHLFLGVRFNCNKCHDHPFERWTQDQYYQTTAFFSRIGLKPDGENSGERTIGGTAVEGAKPLFEIVYDKEEGETVHERTGAVTAPQFPFAVELTADEQANRRQRLAKWITSSKNDYFVRSYVNRVWGYLLGVGLIEPLDDIRAGNPATNPELLDYLSQQFMESGFNVRALMREIVNSRTYQLSIATNRWNADDHVNYSHARARRLPAEVLYDAVHMVTGSRMHLPGVPEGTRAAALPDAASGLPDGFLVSLGRPARESACECERSSELQLGPVMSLMNGETINHAISNPDNWLAKLVREDSENERVVDAIFKRILSRPAKPEEIAAVLQLGMEAGDAHRNLDESLQTYRRQVQPEIDRRQQAHAEALAAARAELERYRAEIAPAQAQLDQLQAEQVEVAAADLSRFDQTELEEALASWAQNTPRATSWVGLDPKELSNNTETKLKRLPDQSVLGSGRGTSYALYSFKAETNVSRITAVKIEALTHESLPNFGPGFADDGNFVLSEVVANWALQSAPQSVKPLAFASAQATIEEGGEFALAGVINQVLKEEPEGWSVKPGTGRDQALILTLAKPVELKEPAELSFVLQQVYRQRDHTLGRFRISITDAADPSHFGIPREIDRILSVAAAARSQEESEQLLTWFKSQYPERRAKELEWRKRALPRPEDTGITERQARVTELSRPLPEDPQLARLQRAVALSQQQLQNLRLTIAQDLAWALINSPAFLFNR